MSSHTQGRVPAQRSKAREKGRSSSRSGSTTLERSIARVLRAMATATPPTDPGALHAGPLAAARHRCQQPSLGASDRPRNQHQTKQARAWVRADEQIARPCCGERWPSRAQGNQIGSHDSRLDAGRRAFMQVTACGHLDADIQSYFRSRPAPPNRSLTLCPLLHPH